MSAPPRLFYIDDIPTPYRVGVFRRLADAWPGSFAVAFCAEKEPGRTFDLDLSGLNTQFLAGRQWRPLGQVNPFSFKWNPGVAAALEAFAPDVVVLSGYAHPTMIRAARWCRSRHIPYALACETSARSTSTSGLRWHLRRRVIGWMVRDMAFGLPVGREAAAYLRMLGAAGVPMHFFPNTPDTTLFQQTAARLASNGGAQVRRRYALPAKGPIFTFVGRLIPAKRPIDAVQSFLQLPSDKPAGFLIVGDGPEMQAAQNMAGGDPRIAFAGWIRDERELAEIFAASSALVLPSEHEPWGAVVNEAMASGTCVIAADRVGAAVELIDNGVEGFLVSVGDIAAIRESMLTLIEDPNRSLRMGGAAQRKALGHGAEFAALSLLTGAREALAMLEHR